jgi:UDP-2-acetamido-2-deoxy-ribo-hexuluronate aminotransferase
MQVPFIDITRYEPKFFDHVCATTQELIKKGHFVGGPVVAEFEQALKHYTDTKFALGCANGTDAIQLALRAAGVQKNDLVCLPDMTFWATFEAVVNVGADPITLDVSRETLHLTLKDVQQAIEKYRPKALILVHLYGWAAPETLEIRRYCEEKKVILIEDCAQAMGTKIHQESLLKGAKVATTSFYPAKVLGASGDAGAVFTNDLEICETLKKLINHGRTAHYEHGLIGWNSRLGAYEANFMLAALKHLDEKLHSRRASCEFYRKNIKQKHLKLVHPHASVWENGYLFVGLMEPQIRAKFITYLKEKSIGYGTVYPGAMSDQPGAKEHLKGKISEGNATWIAQAVINLPCFPYMTKDELTYVVEQVNQFNP